MFRSALRGSCLTLLLLLGSALAQDPVTLSLDGFLVIAETTDEGPVERFVPALEAAPGDLIEWRLHAVNTSDAPLRSLALELPLSGQVAYLPGSARAGVGEDALPLDTEADPDPDALVATFSSDGGASFHFPPLLRDVVEIRDGEQVTVQQPVDPAEYTHARVVLPELESGGSFTFVVRTEVR